MASNQRFPHARRRRRPTLRLALVGAAAALAALVIVPAVISGSGAAVPDSGATNADQAPTPTGQAVAGVTATPAPATAPPPAQVAQSPSPAAGAAIALRPQALGAGIPPTRLAPEITGTTAPALGLLTGYRWPLAHPRLTLPFGPTVWGSRLVDGERFHDGVDLATFCGDRVMATHAGTVLAAGRRYDAVMGWVGDLAPYLRRLEKKNLWTTLPIVVVVDDGNGYRSMYAHFGRIVVKKGQQVRAGQLLGYEGMTGRASGCHLHYGLFSPWETSTFRIRPDVVARMKLPKAEIARVDPLQVLPPKPGINAPAKPDASPGSPDASPGSPDASP